MIVLLAACGDAERESTASTQSAQLEYRRHLELGRDQLRRGLLESAQAELERCAQLNPGEREVDFQTARLLLARRSEPERVEAVRLLETLLAADPGDLRALRLLAECSSRAGRDQAMERCRAAFEREFGRLGRLELEALADFAGTTRRIDAFLPRGDPARSGDADYTTFVLAARRLLREGSYDPSQALPALERILEDRPQLALLRLFHARLLVRGEIRVNYSDRPDLPSMSSKLVYDLARAHVERAFDQLDPTSQPALEALTLLSEIGLQMADYDEAEVFTDLVLAWPGLERPVLGSMTVRMSLVRFKQQRYAETAAILEGWLQQRPGPPDMTVLWLLHLAQESLGTPTHERRFDFRFRADLAGPGAETALAFEDVAERLGIAKRDGLGPSAWGDYDRDGDFDLFVTGGDSYGALYRNDGSRFADVTREAGLYRVQSGFSATFVDYDNDGWRDLYVGRDGWNGPAPNSLYRNRGDGTFVDVTEHAGVGDPGSSFVHAWSDADRDGDLDLFVANGITGSGEPNRFYRNDGDGTFTEATEAAGLLERPGLRTIGAAWGDYDGDGWPDLFVSGFMTLNRLYRNRGDGSFEELASRAGVAGADSISAGYVCFFADLDGDARLDILRTSLAPFEQVLLALWQGYADLPAGQRKALLATCTRLYRNQGDGTFADLTEQAGLVHPLGTMGANIGDVDNDGWLDLYFGTGDPRIFRMEPDRFYRNDGGARFSDLTFAVGLGNVGKGHGATFVDWDGDGDLELYAPEGGFVHGDAWPNAFYLNHQSTPNHWLHVDLEGVRSNRDAVGAELLVDAGGQRLLRVAQDSEGFGSTNSPTVEFGLGSAERVERLEIRWPSGELQAFEDLPVDRRIFVREGQAWRPWPPKD